LGGLESEMVVAEFVNALTLLTSFFRESHRFEILASHLAREDALGGWCSASSTGEEPYSILMTAGI
jgi:chemotaxis protein methyltransferase CheR